MEDHNELKERIEKQMVVCFKICHPNDEANNRTAEVFREFCRRESNNNYLNGIQKLLEAYSTDWKYETLHQEIAQLRAELAEIRKEESKSTDRSLKTFGGKI